MDVDVDKPADLLAAARELGSSTLSEAGGNRGSLPVSIRPLDRDVHLAARALPVISPPGDNLWLHRAVRDAQPGEVLVVDVGNGPEFGYWGEVLTEAALAHGVAGVVINGCVRDAAALRRIGFPTFCVGLCVSGTTKRPDGVGAIGEPIRIGTVEIHRGDLVVGDEDGVVVVPADRAAEVVAAGARRQAGERDIIARVRAGESTLKIYDLAE